MLFEEEELGFREKDISFSWETFEIQNFDKPLSWYKQFYRKALKEGPLGTISENKYSLSEDQQQVYDVISKDIKEGLTQQQTYLISSAAGTGKGILIETLYYCAKRHGIKAKIVTPTGVAATRFPCLASTIHSSLGLPLGKTAEEIISMPVSHKVIMAWKDVKLFFVDEVYLIPCSFWYVINIKLQQIFNNSEPYGGCSVIVSGDMLQNMCIGGVPLYSETQCESEICEKGRMLYRGITKVFMLIKNHRQKDKEYLKILEGLKHNQIVPDDLALLNSRHESRLSDNEIKEFSDALYISLRRDSVLKRNKQMLLKSGKPVLLTHARRFGAEDGGIIPLYLSEGCPLILNENINVNMGLVNGSFGYCRGIVIKDRNLKECNVFSSQLPKPYCVLVDFPDINGRTLKHNLFPIFSQTKNLESAHSKSSFPVFPLETFFSATITKIQGKTLKKVIVKVEPWYDWAPFFVAMSRVSYLRDLMIVGEMYSTNLFPYHNKSYNTKMRELVRLEKIATKQENDLK